MDQVGLGDDFYLAINKKELGTATKWFLSSYLRQNHPAGVYNSAAVSLGNARRVVQAAERPPVRLRHRLAQEDERL